MLVDLGTGLIMVNIELLSSFALMQTFLDPCDRPLLIAVVALVVVTSMIPGIPHILRSIRLAALPSSWILPLIRRETAITCNRQRLP